MVVNHGGEGFPCSRLDHVISILRSVICAMHCVVDGAYVSVRSHALTSAAQIHHEQIAYAERQEPTPSLTA